MRRLIAAEALGSSLVAVSGADGDHPGAKRILGGEGEREAKIAWLGVRELAGRA